MILGVIPARGGSKGVPRKNIRLVAGQPLIAWTIQAAQAAKSMDRFVVSTEDEEIAAVSKRFGADVLVRPAALASDEASTMDVLKHALEKIPADTIVLLQATSPIRDEGLIDSCVKRFFDTKADSLATGFICKCREYATNELRRQDIKGFFYDDGSIYIMRADLLRAGDRYGKKIERVLLDREQCVDIDDEFDLWLAEKVLLKRRGA